MSKSNDPGHFFQTEVSLEEASRRKTKSKNIAGSPIRLASKLLAVISDPRNPSIIYVAESAGYVRRIDLDSPEQSTVYTGPTAPITSLALSSDSTILLAGCWDKTIWSWRTSTRAPAHRFTGVHDDFVKCIACTVLPGTQSEILISGSADASIVVWSVATGEKLHSIRGHTRPVLALAVQPPSEAQDGVTLWSAASDRSIRRHRITQSHVEALPFPTSPTTSGEKGEVEDMLTLHETSVNALAFSTAADDGGLTLLTASSDKSAARSTATGDVWTSAATYPHPDFVKAILPIDAPGGLLLATGCRDEAVRLFDGEDVGTAEPVFVLDGHYDEVAGLACARAGGLDVLVSVGLDGTVRRWPIDRAGLERVAKQGLTETKEDKDEGPVLTAEEEAELAELMDED